MYVDFVTKGLHTRTAVAHLCVHVVYWLVIFGNNAEL